MYRLALVTCLTIAAAGGADKHFDDLMASWHGHTVRDLVGTWGPPTYV
jgi:hypothetical protein